jgi:hypothetical protein
MRESIAIDAAIAHVADKDLVLTGREKRMGALKVPLSQG